MGKALTVLMAAAATLGCASQPPPSVRDTVQEPRPTFLTHEELKALLSRTLTVHFAGYGQRGTGIFEKDGTARLDGGNWRMFGSWRIEGNRFCTSYSQIGTGCYNLHQTASNSYTLFPTQGSGSSTWEVQR